MIASRTISLIPSCLKDCIVGGSSEFWLKRENTASGELRVRVEIPVGDHPTEKVDAHAKLLPLLPSTSSFLRFPTSFPMHKRFTVFVAGSPLATPNSQSLMRMEQRFSPLQLLTNLTIGMPTEAAIIQGENTLLSFSFVTNFTCEATASNGAKVCVSRRVVGVTSSAFLMKTDAFGSFFTWLCLSSPSTERWANL